MSASHAAAPCATVMIVDDDQMILRALSRVLRHAGYRVVTHDTGLGLSELVRESAPDLLLLDVNMPGLGGADALSMLRAPSSDASGRDVPVIFHSGLPANRLADLAREHGAAGHLRKPARNAILLETVEQVLAGSAS